LWSYLAISADISNGGLIIDEAASLPTNQVELSGHNTYALGTTLNSGTLRLNSNGFNDAIPGNLTIGDGSGAAGSAVVKLLQSDELPALAVGAEIEVKSDGRLDLNGYFDSVGRLTLDAGGQAGGGNLTITTGLDVNGGTKPASLTGVVNLPNADTHFTVTGGSATPADLVVSAVLSGTGGLLKDGAGSMQLTADNSYDGTTTLDGGTLDIKGSQPGAVTVNGGTLEGTGTVGSVNTHGGTVHPGESPGVLHSGAVSFNSSTAFSVQVNGTQAGTQYSQLISSGSVDLGGANLAVALGYTPTDGDSYTIIQGTSITGTFAQGSSITVNGHAFTILYNSDRVVLTAGTPKPTISHLSTLDAAEGANDFTLTVYGSNFLPTSIVSWISYPDYRTQIATPLATSYVSGSELQAVVTASLLSEEGVHGISVGNGSVATVFGVAFVVFDPVTVPQGTHTVSGVEGTVTAPQVVATFTDPAGPETLDEYAATIDWGDQQTSDGQISFANGVFSVSGSHQYAEEGTYAISVTIYHPPGLDFNYYSRAQATASISDAAVRAQGQSISGTEGTDTGSQLLATFTDPGGVEALADYSATVDWGDGQTGAGVISFSNGGFSVTGSHSYAEEGNHGVTVTINHDQAPQATAFSNAVISDPPVLAQGQSIIGTEGASTGSQLLATFTDPGGAEAVGDYSASIDWGDGQTSAGVIGFSSGVFGVTGSHTYAEEDNHGITVTIKHDQAPQTVAFSNASIIDAALFPQGGFTIAGVEGMATGSNAVATFTDPGGVESPGDYSASIDWGDGHTSAGTISLSNGAFTVSGSNTFAEEGNYDIKVTIIHDQLPSVAVSSSAVIADAPLSGMASAVSAIAGAPLSATLVTFQDADPAGTLSDYHATIYWGDGTNSTGVIGTGSSAFTISGSHTYASAGSDAFNVQITDIGGATVTIGGTATISALGKGVSRGLAATIGFWNAKNGQALIRQFNGGATATALGNWLAMTFPSLYGPTAGTNSLAGKTNSQVAQYFQALFVNQQTKVNAQVLSTALSVYATTMSLGGTVAQQYGFIVTTYGLGAYSFNVGSDGPAFGVPNGTTLNVYQVLQATNQMSMNGILYNGNATWLQEALQLYTAINQAGDIVS
jgi:autotransporter-associated beta strand protein